MDSRLFVKNLPPDIKEHEVRYIFGKYGTVLQVELVPGVRGDVAIQYCNAALAPVELHIVPSTGNVHEHACAFVTYSTNEAAATAVRVLHNIYKVRNSSKEPISVRIAHQDNLPEPVLGPGVSHHEAIVAAGASFMTPKQTALSGFSSGPTSATYAFVAEKAKCKLFVGNLYPDITQEALKAVFGQWGTVVHVHIKTGKSRFGSACAFVELASPQAAEAARLGLHQKFDARIGAGGAPIQVTFFQSGGGGKGAGGKR